VPMVAMLSLLGCYFEHRAHRGLDGDQGAGGDRRRTLQGRSAAEDVGRETFLSREEARRAGEESRTTGVAAEAIEAKPAFGQISPSRDRLGVCIDSRSNRRPGECPWLQARQKRRRRIVG
jgi:hypothetical protein